MPSVTLDRLPIVFAAVLCLAMTTLALAPFPKPDVDLAAFRSAFASLGRTQSLLLFPLGVATSILTMIVLLRHGRLFSSRGLFQAATIFALFVSGIISTNVSQATGDEITRLAADGRGAEVVALLARWQTLQLVAFVAGWIALAALVLAERQPLPVAEASVASTLTPRHRSLLFLLGAATLFEGYDRFIASLALPYIGEDLGASEAALGFALSAIRLGSLASIAFGRVADRHGRRGLLLFTILAYTVTTAATGLSQGLTTFVIFQLCATIFLTTELALAQVVITEEFPANFRAAGQGFLGAFGALGAGLAALLFPILQETALGWRGLYFIGILPLLLIAYMRRSLPETERFLRARAEGRTEVFRFVEFLAPALRRRFLVLIGVSIFGYAATSPAFAFASYHATHAFGFTPAKVSSMIILGGSLGLLGWFVFGGLAERLGRRPVGVVSLIGCGAAVLAFFQTTWPVPSFGLLVFMEAGMSVAINSLGTELFPTRMRSTAKSWIINASIVGALIGLAIVGALSVRLGGASAVVTLLGVMPVVASPLFLLLPEPRGHDLEEF